MADLVNVEYCGPFRPGVVLTGPDGRPIRADYGETIEVDKATAKGLLTQTENWREPKHSAKPKPHIDETGGD